ncbi:hypothetical protein PENTCL1PPCAC_3159 [Pristionchus entomophagus]|uniref:Protein kinase domain-containing protein n=1 Tax=Pristionchus entomophagus TaxID=358040 RepID=A0AAV5SHU9_9BILA|nr:hypothetical protein PENTCL1PPCAC_3159 [Pristionchus entomophagus]
MDLIWLTLNDVIKKVCKGAESSHSKIIIARQTLEALETLHELGFAHRNVKPHTFAVGLPPNDHIIYCIGFGIAPPYRDSKGEVK